MFVAMMNQQENSYFGLQMRKEELAVHTSHWNQLSKRKLVWQELNSYLQWPIESSGNRNLFMFHLRLPALDEASQVKAKWLTLSLEICFSKLKIGSNYQSNN